MIRAVLAAVLAAAVSAALAPAVPALAAESGQSGQVRTQAAFTPAPIRWGSCAKSSYVESLGAECGYLRVPLDYDDPAGAMIKLYVARIEHTSSAAAYKGAIVTNPGGPGESGTALVELGQLIPHRVGDDFDWIGLDPRGVGASVPSLHCDSSIFSWNRPAYRPATKKLMTAWRHRTADYSRACSSADAGDLLDHVTTMDSARDLESLRVALGVKKISYYGYSYGTYLGQVYATRYPARVDRLVLDSNVDPRGVWYDDNLAQNVAFEKNMDRFWAYLARHPKTFKLGSKKAKIKAGYAALLEHLGKHPAHHGKVGPDELADVMTEAGYYVYDWALLGKAYSALARHKSSGTIAAWFKTSMGDDNSYAMYNAVQCSDATWPTAWSKWTGDARRQDKKSPFLTWSNLWFNAPCFTWHSTHAGPVKVSGAAISGDVLLIDEQYDAATPYQGSLEVRRRFPTASLIEGVGGSTHASSMSGVACVDDAVARYLKTGVAPKRMQGPHSDKKCPAVPVPKANSAPGKAVAARKGSYHRSLGRLSFG